MIPKKEIVSSVEKPGTLHESIKMAVNRHRTVDRGEVQHVVVAEHEVEAKGAITAEKQHE